MVELELAYFKEIKKITVGPVAATAAVHQARLLTKDRLILKNCSCAVWEE
ncbi:MAG: hypothetical protein JNM63_10990 [Spirochaetia bacterium]|nr:hypothetical protein [Spirochaetia bacterium]